MEEQMRPMALRQGLCLASLLSPSMVLHLLVVQLVKNREVLELRLDLVDDY